MKNILLASLLLTASFNSFSQTQIPNGDFENWKAFPHCEGIDSLVNFFTYDEFIYYGSIQGGKAGYCNPTPTAIKTTDKQSGTYALKLTTLNLGTFGYASNFVQLGSVGTYDGLLGATGAPFTGRPTKLTGYYKFTKGGTDTLGFSIATSNESDFVAFGELSINESSNSDYTKFEIPLEYNPLITGNPTDI
ncbi:MAG: hypothetical protein H7259_02950, partial [Cytophagales bacterium]|nr:hypothetical protein [Cytophaga sp.]